METTKTATRAPKIRRTRCPHCGVNVHAIPAHYVGRVMVTQSWDGNSIRDIHVFECGNCGLTFEQRV